MTVFNDKFTMKVMLADVVYILLFHSHIEKNKFLQQGICLALEMYPMRE